MEDDAIDSGASAKANLQAAVDDLHKIVSLNHAKDLLALADELATAGCAGTLVGAFLLAVSPPGLIVFEAMDVVVQPLIATKDLVDAAFHGVVAGLRKLTS